MLLLQKILCKYDGVLRSFGKAFGKCILVYGGICILLIKRGALKIEVVKGHAGAQYHAAVDVVAQALGQGIKADLQINDVSDLFMRVRLSW